MQRFKRSASHTVLLVLTTAFAVACSPHAPPSDGFADTIVRLSGPGGYFDTDNLISNERSYLHAISDLRAANLRGGAYLGVGPGQNFSYIAEIEPEVAVIIDVRRDNVLQHLIYKAIFEAAPTRAEYLALLTGRAVPDAPALNEAGAAEIVAAIDGLAVTDESRRRAETVVREGVERFGFAVSAGDHETIRRFHEEFIQNGLDLQFTSHGRGPQFYYPTLRDLVLEIDREGEPASYLASHARYETVRDLQLADRVLPVVGDLGGATALRAIGEHLRAHDLEVTAFYTSNIEFYLFGSRTYGQFIQNLEQLPFAVNGVLIKSIFPAGYRRAHPLSVPGYYSTQVVQDVAGLVRGWTAGDYTNYWSIVTADLLGEPR